MKKFLILFLLAYGLKASSRLAFSLIEPRFIDYPYIGEQLILKINNIKCTAIIVDIANDYFDILVAKSEETFLPKVLLDHAFRVQRSGENSHETCSVAIRSGLNSSLGASLMLPTNVFILGLAALLGMSGAILQANEIQDSFNLEAGGDISYKIKEIKR